MASESRRIAFAVFGIVLALLVLASSVVVEVGALRSSSSSRSKLAPGVLLHTRDRDKAEDADLDLEDDGADETTTAIPATTVAATASTTSTTAPVAVAAKGATGSQKTTSAPRTPTAGPATSPPTLIPGAGVCFAPNRGKEAKFEVTLADGKKKSVKYCECFPGFGGLRCSIEVLKTKEMATISLPGSETTAGAKQHTPASFVKSVDGKTGEWEVVNDALEYTIADKDGQMVAVLQATQRERADLSLNTVVGKEGSVVGCCRLKVSSFDRLLIVSSLFWLHFSPVQLSIPVHPQLFASISWQNRGQVASQAASARDGPSVLAPQLPRIAIGRKERAGPRDHQDRGQGPCPVPLASAQEQGC